MAINTNTNAYQIINELNAEGFGKDVAVTAVDTSSFVAAGQNFTSLGTDEVMNNISKVIQRTLFSIRPYAPKLGLVEMDKNAFSFAERRLSICDSDFIQGSIPVPAEGTSGDQWVVHKAKVLEQVFAGSDLWQYQMPSITRTQLLNAFRSEDELVTFFGMIVTNMYNSLAKAKESACRGLFINLIAAKKFSNAQAIESKTYRHLVTEYNAYKGYETALTLTDIRKDHYKDFMEFVYAQIKTASLNLEEMTQLYHTNKTGFEITRHTPKADQRLVMLAPEVFNMDASVLSNTFNKELLTYTDYEQIAYWQNINDPASVKATPVYMKADGTTATAAEQTCTNVFAVLYDKDALGMTIIDESVLSTPLNAKYKYYNTFAEANVKIFTDFTQNAIVFALD